MFALLSKTNVPGGPNEATGQSKSDDANGDANATEAAQKSNKLVGIIVGILVVALLIGAAFYAYARGRSSSADMTADDVDDLDVNATPLGKSKPLEPAGAYYDDVGAAADHLYADPNAARTVTNKAYEPNMYLQPTPLGGGGSDSRRYLDRRPSETPHAIGVSRSDGGPHRVDFHES